MTTYPADRDFMVRLIDSYSKEIAYLRRKEARRTLNVYLLSNLLRIILIMSITTGLHSILLRFFSGLPGDILRYLTLIIALFFIYKKISLGIERVTSTHIPMPYIPPITANLGFPRSSLLSHQSRVNAKQRKMIHKHYNEGSENTKDKIVGLENEIEALRKELHEIAQASKAKPRNERVADTSLDCQHLGELVSVHKKYIHDLELKKAAFGLHFPTHMALELEERYVRLEELTQRIEKECS